MSSGPSITSLLRRVPRPLRHGLQQALHNRGYDLVAAGQATAGEAEPYLNLLRHGLGHLTTATAETHFPVTKRLYQRITPDSLHRFPSILTDQERTLFDTYSEEHRMRETLRLGVARLPESFSMDTGLSVFAPPDDVHAMVRAAEFIGDQYYCDLLTSALERAGTGFRDAETYLDFGSSSGRVVRTLATAFPDTRFLGCDPNPRAIEWASLNIPDADFFVSSITPPLENIADRSLDGAYAISIWSHYAQDSSLRWMDEMRRIVKPGGHLVFTTHGVGSLLHYLDRAILPEALIARLTDSLLADGFAFYDAFGSDGDWGVVDSDWGNAFIHPAFALQHMLEGWSLLSYEPRRAEGNQDVYVLQRISS